jgi:hypothetical protein
VAAAVWEHTPLFQYTRLPSAAQQAALAFLDNVARRDGNGLCPLRVT